MGFFNSMDISASALTAQRLRMDVISENVANMDTTRTADGTPYRRRVAVLGEAGGDSFQSAFGSAMSAGSGVQVSGIVEDQSPFKLEYDPTHPDANADGYVQLPNVDVVTEMVDMMAATRAYEANVTALNATKSMALKALEIND